MSKKDMLEVALLVCILALGIGGAIWCCSVHPSDEDNVPKCVYCDTEYDNFDYLYHETWCKKCGRDVWGHFYCPVCGNKIDKDSEYCSDCGVDVRDSIKEQQKEGYSSGKTKETEKTKED